MTRTVTTRASAPGKAYSFFKLVIGGFIEDSQTWSCGFAFKANPNTSQGDMQAWVDAAKTDVENWWITGLKPPVTQNTPDTTLSSLRLYHYLAGQRQAVSIAEQALARHPGTSQTPGTARDSLVIGLYAKQPGAHYRGRVYVPCTGPQLGLDHQFDLSIPTLWVTNTVTLLGQLGARQLGGINPLPIIASSLPEPPVIVSVRGDTLPDTQRRRSDKLGQNAEYRLGLVFE